jgi:ferredoxin
MPKVTFYPSGRIREVAPGTLLYAAAQAAGLPVASSCNAEGVCGQCNLAIVQGAENLSLKGPLEVRLLEKERHPADDRISCLTKVLGDCAVRAPYW